jgi:undecaprenyl pyrophosphate synthase
MTLDNYSKRTDDTISAVFESGKVMTEKIRKLGHLKDKLPKIEIIGCRGLYPKEVVDFVKELEEMTQNNKGTFY